MELPERQISARNILKPLYAAELTFSATVVVCSLILFDHSVSVYGISYWGIRLATVPVLVIGLTATSLLLFQAASRLPDDKPFTYIALCFRVVGVGAILLLLTPYTAGTFFNWAHMTIGAAFFLAQMTTSTYLYIKLPKDSWLNSAIVVQLLGGIMAMLSLPDNLLALMLQGEVLFQIGFALLINRTLKVHLAAPGNNQKLPDVTNGSLGLKSKESDVSQQK
ncbi:MAG: hypothetical protein HKL81_07440 [Acidimicrobiaceae bacterium]|nr:hypothetical protein [Acidimicrobiaceae bacterium]